MSGSNLQLDDLFRACDRGGKGYVTCSELRELCGGFGISSVESDTIFEDLDKDEDGKISLADFTAGFKEFFSPSNDDVFVERTYKNYQSNNDLTNSNDEDVPKDFKSKVLNRRESAQNAWGKLADNVYPNSVW